MTKKMILLLGAVCALGLLATGCSDDDNPATPAIDTAPPAAPTALASCSATTGVKLSWRPNVTDTDLAGYLVYRIAFGQTWRLTADPLQTCCFLDRAPLPGAAVYAVSAVDEAGNESVTVQCMHNCDTIDREIDRP